MSHLIDLIGLLWHEVSVHLIKNRVRFVTLKSTGNLQQKTQSKIKIIWAGYSTCYDQKGNGLIKLLYWKWTVCIITVVFHGRVERKDFVCAFYHQSINFNLFRWKITLAILCRFRFQSSIKRNLRIVSTWCLRLILFNICVYYKLWTFILEGHLTVD